MSEKNRALYARRALKKMGYGLSKSRKRNFDIDDQGGYMIYDLSYNLCIWGSNYDLSIDDVFAFIEQ